MPRGKLPLRIKSEGLVAKNASILLGDIDISNHTAAVELSCGVGDVNKVVLTLYPTSLDVDVEALLELQARFAKQEDEAK